MNFFGHATVALAHSDAPDFILGAMLPDFASMAGVRPQARPDSELGRGVAHHHEVDVAFHRAPAFLAACRSAIEELPALGIPRGSARAIGHVGSELLIDGLLSADARALAAYRSALEAGRHGDALHALSDPSRADARALTKLFERLCEAPLPSGYREPEFVGERLERILARRPRLAFDSGDRPEVVRWLASTRPRLERGLPALLETLTVALK